MAEKIAGSSKRRDASRSATFSSKTSRHMKGEGSSSSETNSARYVESSVSSWSQSSQSFITRAGNAMAPSKASTIGSMVTSRPMMERTKSGSSENRLASSETRRPSSEL